jgi:hypothetical protein
MCVMLGRKRKVLLIISPHKTADYVVVVVGCFENSVAMNYGAEFQKASSFLGDGDLRKECAVNKNYKTRVH